MSQPLQPGVPIRLRSIDKHFSGRVIFRSLDLELESGDFVSLVGASGCGKSTLLRIIGGLEAADAGDVDVLRNGTAFVFQDASLLPWRTAAQNVSLTLELLGISAAERPKRVAEALEQVGLARDHALHPSQLSGGMRMRVSLARALVSQPRLLLLDEPFAALDELTRVHLEEELRALWLKQKMTVVFVTHSFSEAVFLSNRIVMLSEAARGVGDVMHVRLGERNEALRATPEFGQLVQQCRARFEKLQRSGR